MQNNNKDKNKTPVNNHNYYINKKQLLEYLKNDLTNEILKYINKEIEYKNNSTITCGVIKGKWELIKLIEDFKDYKINED